jgi:hypothetical protein
LPPELSGFARIAHSITGAIEHKHRRPYISIVVAVEDGMRFDRVVTQVFNMLQEVRLGTIVAVWADGGVSAHRDLAFRHRVLPDGRRESPLATFVATSDVPSVVAIRDQIKRAVGPAALE